MRKVGESFLSIAQKLAQGSISYNQVEQSQDIRQSMQEIDFYKELYSGLNPMNEVPSNLLIETKLKRAYRYRSAFEITLQHIDTGEEKTYVASIYHNDNMSYNQLRQAYWDSVMRVGESPNVTDLRYYDYTIKSFDIISVWHESGAPY